MPINKTIQGDLIEAFINNEVRHMAHGVNCFGVMGAGIARTVQKEIPDAFRAYQAVCDSDQSDGKSLLGGICFGVGPEQGNGLCFNLFTQHYPGPDARMECIEKAFSSLNEKFGHGAQEGVLARLEGTLGIPMIGCGIGGLVWSEVEELINRVTPNIQIVLYVLK
jgi:O-acetyl-ADP-ribose deacetylase (regulator of RNase III)